MNQQGWVYRFDFTQDYQQGQVAWTLFDRQRTEAVRMPFLLVDGIMQQQDGVRSVKAERLEALDTLTASIDAHDFYSPARPWPLPVRRSSHPPTDHERRNRLVASTRVATSGYALRPPVAAGACTARPAGMSPSSSAHPGRWHHPRRLPAPGVDDWTA